MIKQIRTSKSIPFFSFERRTAKAPILNMTWSNISALVTKKVTRVIGLVTIFSSRLLHVSLLRSESCRSILDVLPHIVGVLLRANFHHLVPHFFSDFFSNSFLPVK